MNIFIKMYARSFQFVMYLGAKFLNFNEPTLIKGEGSFDEVAKTLQNLNKNRVLIVTDEFLHSIKVDEKLAESLKKFNVNYEYFYSITANPTVTQVEDGLKIYKSSNCDCIVAIGGGSAMDAAKGIGARVTNPKKSIKKMKGLLKVTHKLPLLIAIPTTAGTGSECTLAAVISNRETKEKFPLEDPHLIPKYAVLNPTLLVNLPSHMTSTVGMDALTHAVEAFIGWQNTRKTKKAAIDATRLINENLVNSYNDPTNLTYRENMQVAAYKAGIAFTRAYVGYVHAVAHALGGYYNVPHGLANAVILPIVLKEYGKKAYNKLSKLYDVINPNSNKTKKEKAELFISWIESLNEKMDIKNTFKDKIKDEDISILVDHAYKEAIPLYPTPELWDKARFKKIFTILKTK